MSPSAASAARSAGMAAGHAFIAYVREDSAHVDRLQQILEDAGVPVWRDTADLLPGQDWQAEIRGAITGTALAFLACFSQASVARQQSYQNEELHLAIEQLRLRPHDVTWFIPIRFDDCEIPDWDIGGGRTLRYLQHADLFGDRCQQSTVRLVQVVRQIVGGCAETEGRAAPKARTGRAAAARAALDQLPPSISGFAGRDDDLTNLLRLLGPTGSGDAVVVSAVAGLAGVGKTTLAIEAGHAARRQGWFGGGVLFLDLRGYDLAPVTAGQALDALLRALGTPAERIPAGEVERSALYRSILAERTQPVLVIADNASSETQVRPLLPGTGSHKVLVTSRHTLASLGARLVDVQVLDDDASVELLNTVVRTARPDDERIHGDQDAARRLAGLCGGLPLALQITAALLTADPALSAPELADQLAVESERLDQLRYTEGAGPGLASVAAAFELSYRQLEEVPARVFRLLSVNAGPDTSTAATAILAGLPLTLARRALASLVQAHMIEPAAGRAGRWRMHDLLRLYARQLRDEDAFADDREQARDRLLNYYLARAYSADQHLRAQSGPAVPGGFADRGTAVEWLDSERPNLLASVSMAADADRDQFVIQLPLVLAEYLQLRRHFDDWLSITTVSLARARHLQDHRREREALITLGNVLRQLGRFHDAAGVCREAVSLCRQTGDQPGEAGALNNLGNALHELGMFDEAIRAQQDSLGICRSIGDRRAEGRALNGMGLSMRRLGRLDEAIIAHQNAAAFYEQAGDKYGEGTALNNLGLAYYQAQRFEEAVTAYKRDLAICRELGDRHGEATTLNNIGAARQDQGRFEEAITAHQDAIARFREPGERQEKAKALSNLGHPYRETGRFEEAVAVHQHAAALYHESKNPHSEGRAKADLGITLHQAQRPQDAITALRQAAAIFRETGDQDSERAALHYLDAIHDPQET